MVTHFRLRRGNFRGTGECRAAVGGGGTLAGSCGLGRDAPPALGGVGRAMVRGPPASVLDSRFGLGDRIGRRGGDYCHSTLFREDATDLSGRCVGAAPGWNICRGEAGYDIASLDLLKSYRGCYLYAFQVWTVCPLTPNIGS